MQDYRRFLHAVLPHLSRVKVLDTGWTSRAQVKYVSYFQKKDNVGICRSSGLS
jgi:hypothetical protein